MKIKHLLAALLAALSFGAHSQVPPGGAWNLFYLSLSVGAEYIDTDSVTPYFYAQNRIVHICGGLQYPLSGFPQNTRSGGGYVVGLHVKSNLLLCSKAGADAIENFDYDTMRGGMHACPPGKVVTGIHVNDNILACASLNMGRVLLPETERAAYWGDRHGMHACPVGWVITGVHVNNNQFLCTATSGPGSELPVPPIGGGGPGGGIGDGPGGESGEARNRTVR